jgi:hypothetical protein
MLVDRLDWAGGLIVMSGEERVMIVPVLDTGDSLQNWAETEAMAVPAETKH